MTDDDIQIAIWDDPEWSPALEAFRERGHVAPLAALLRSGKEVPLQVANAIGKMLEPPRGYRGPSLQLKLPKRSLKQFVDKQVENLKLGQRLREIQGDGKLEAAVLSLQEETGLSRSIIFEAYKLDTKAVVLGIATLMGDATPEEQKTKS